MGSLRVTAENIFDRYNIYSGDGEYQHCMRLYDFALLHARELGIWGDEDLIYLAAMLHDLGLMVPRRKGTTYLTRTVEIAKSEIQDDDLDDDEWAVLNDCLLHNHAVRLPHPLSPIAEAFRRAVFTEHSRGILRFGLTESAVREVFARRPYGNFLRVVASFIWKTVVFEPSTVVGIFFPRKSELESHPPPKLERSPRLVVPTNNVEISIFAKIASNDAAIGTGKHDQTR